MSEGSNKREFTRVDVDIAAEVQRPGGQPVMGVVEVISMNGLMIATEDTLPDGLHCQIKLILRGGIEPLSFEVFAEVVRSNKSNQLAFAFTQVPVESYTHLKNIVLANAPEADVVENEFETHVGIRPKNQPGSD
jgi:hypothetical protein